MKQRTMPRRGSILPLLFLSRRSPPPGTAAFSVVSPAPRRTPPTALTRTAMAHGDDGAAAAAKAAAFRSWCNSAGIVASSLEHAKSDMTGGVGVCVRPYETISAGEVAIVLPADAALVLIADENRNGGVGAGGGDDDDDDVVVSPVPHLLDDESWKDARSDYRLATLLVDERRKGSFSKIAGYVNHLPPPSAEAARVVRMDTLERWSNAELSLLRNPGLKACAEHRRYTNDEWFDSVRPEEWDFDSGREYTGGQAMSREEFDWALDAVQTRAFSGNFAEGSRGAKDCALLPFIDDVNHGFKSKSVVGGDAGAEETEEDQRPMVREVMKFDTESNCFIWRAQEQYVGGDELTQGYLQGVNEEFLLTWGFSSDQNNDDMSRIHVDGVMCKVCQDGTLHEEEKMMEELLEGSSSTEEEVWLRVADACVDEGWVLAREPATDGGPVLDYRRKIAEEFVDGRQQIMRNGYDRARQLAYELKGSRLAQTV